MGRDKRLYRFVQDTRFGRVVLVESHEVATVVKAVTDYVARRLIEREHTLVVAPAPAMPRPRSRFWAFVLGMFVGALALLGAALLMAARGY
jgi:hypothetical protein